MNTQNLFMNHGVKVAVGVQESDPGKAVLAHLNGSLVPVVTFVTTGATTYQETGEKYMPTKEQVIESLEAILVPAAKRSIVGLNLVRGITISDGKVEIALASTGLIPGVQDKIKTKVREAIKKLPEVKEVTVEYSDAKAMEDANGFARITGPCGDTMEIWIKVNDDIIIKSNFMTDGCDTAIASVSMITELARGKNIAEAQRISEQDVLNALGGLPDKSKHCALLSANTLKAAIRDYIGMKRS